MCHYQEQRFICGHKKIVKVKCDKKDCNRSAPATEETALPLPIDCDDEIRCGWATRRKVKEDLIKTTNMNYVRGWEAENEREEGQAWSGVNVRGKLEPTFAAWAQSGGSAAGGSGGGGGDDGDAGALVVYGQDPGQDLGQASWQALHPHTDVGFDPSVGFHPNAGLDHNVELDPDVGQPSSSRAAKDGKSPKKDRKGKGKEKEKGKHGSRETDKGKDKDKGKKKDEGKDKKKSKH